MKTMKKFSYVAISILFVLAIAATALFYGAIHPVTTHSLVASEGGPIVACRPGNPYCNPNQNLREMASEGADGIALASMVAIPVRVA